MANYRNKKLLQLARHHECQYCNTDDGTIVAAHSNQLIHGKGMGIKAHDVFIAYLCAYCHDVVDGRRRPGISQQTREEIWSIAHYNTMRLKSVQKLLDQQALSLLSASAS